MVRAFVRLLPFPAAATSLRSPLVAFHRSSSISGSSPATSAAAQSAPPTSSSSSSSSLLPASHLRPPAELKPRQNAEICRLPDLCNSGNLREAIGQIAQTASYSSSSSPTNRRPLGELKPEENAGISRLVPIPCNSDPLLEEIDQINLPDSSSSYSSPSRRRPVELKPEEIAEINHLIPRLCNSGHLREAVALLDASLLAGGLLHSLPFAALLRRTCSGDEPDMINSMALLTALLHNPNRPAAAITTICTTMVEIYLENGRPKYALKVLDWMLRAKSACEIEPDLYRKLVEGLCRHGRLLEAMKVVREMVAGGGGEAAEVRECVYRRLLHEARVREGKEVEEVLCGMGEGVEEDRRRALQVIDRIILNWRD